MSEEDILKKIQINHNMKHQIVEVGDCREHNRGPPRPACYGPNGFKGRTNFIDMMGKKGSSDGDGRESSDGTTSKSEGGEKKEGGKDKNGGEKGGKKGLFGLGGKSGS